MNTSAFAGGAIFMDIAMVVSGVIYTHHQSTSTLQISKRDLRSVQRPNELVRVAAGVGVSTLRLKKGKDDNWRVDATKQ